MKEEFTGSAKLIFSGVNTQDFEIDVYPDHIFKIEDLIQIKPLLKGLKPNQYGEIIIEGLNVGNYVWYDRRGNNKGVFQISPNEERTYQINL